MKWTVSYVMWGPEILGDIHVEANDKVEAERLAIEELREELEDCGVDEDEPIEVLHVHVSCERCGHYACPGRRS